jgi:hypothetical protein
LVTKARSQSQTKQARESEAYRLSLDIWRRASRAQVTLEAKGEEATPETLWHIVGDENDPPRSFLEALKDERYKNLLEVERRIASLGVVDQLAPLCALLDQTTMLAIMESARDLALFPNLVSTKDKVALAKTTMELSARYTPKRVDDPDSIGSAAVDEEAEMTEALSKIPEALRPRFKELWLEERAKHLRKERALTLVEMNLSESHARTG